MAKGNGRSDPERQKFGQLILPHLHRLRIYALSLTRNRDDADDLVNQTVVKALEGYDKFEPGTNLPAWLFRVQRNVFISAHRLKRVTVPLNAPDSSFSNSDWQRLASPAQSAYHHVVTDLRSFAPYLAMIEPNQADAIIGGKLCDMSYIKIAAAFDVSEGTIKSRISRGTDALYKLVLHDMPTDSIDISTWMHATEGVPESDPYFEIAEAYEDLYKIVKGLPLSAQPRLKVEPRSFFNLKRSRIFEIPEGMPDDLDVAMRE